MFDSARVRGALRCYDAIDRVEDRAVVFLARSSLWVKSERSWRGQHLCSFIFFNTSPSSGKNIRARSREKKPVELNQTALLVDDIYSDLRVDLAMTGAINVRFFLWTFLQKGSERCVLIDFDLQNYPSPVLWRWFSMYPRVSKLVSTTRIVQWSSSRRSFAKMLWRASPKQSRDNRRQQVTVFRAKMRQSSYSIAEETDSSPDPEEKRQQHSCSLLSISLTTEFAHTALSLSQLFFFGAKRYQEKGISRGLIDRSTHAWGFDASNPSWVEHRRMHRCVVATPLFFYSTTP